MQKKAYLLILLAASLWATTGVFLSLLTAAGLTSLQSVAVRNGLATILYFIFLSMTDPKALKIRLADCRYFIGTGILSVVFFNWCLFTTIQSSSLSVASVLLYTSPVFVMILSTLFFHEAITPAKLLALCLTLLGCMLVTGLLPPGGESISGKTILFGLGSGFGYALYTIFSKFALAKYPSGTVSFYTFLFATIGSLPLSGLLKNPQVLLLPAALHSLHGGPEPRRSGKSVHSLFRRAIRCLSAGDYPLPRGCNPFQTAGHAYHSRRNHPAQS